MVTWHAGQQLCVFFCGIFNIFYYSFYFDEFYSCIFNELLAFINESHAVPFPQQPLNKQLKTRAALMRVLTAWVFWCIQMNTETYFIRLTFWTDSFCGLHRYTSWWYWLFLCAMGESFNSFIWQHLPRGS